MTIRPSRAAMFALALGLATGAARAGTIELGADLDDLASANLTLLANGKPVCELSKSADGKAKATSTCRFDFDASATTWQVKGSYRMPGLLARTFKGEQTFKLLDFTATSNLLADSARPYGERMAAFIKATDRFVKAQVPDHYALIEANDPPSAKALDAAAVRVGFALPPEFVSLQRSVGDVRIGDHSLMSADEMHDAYTQMRKVWGTPEEAMQEDYSEKFRATLKASTLLFTEAGDGYGGLLYRPGKTQACGERGTYYWTSQEGGTGVLKNADDSCMDFSAAMRWILNAFVVDEFAETVGDELDHAVLIDVSAGTQAVQLTAGAESFDIRLRGSWSGPHQ